MGASRQEGRHWWDKSYLSDKKVAKASKKEGFFDLKPLKRDFRPVFVAPALDCDPRLSLGKTPFNPPLIRGEAWIPTCMGRTGFAGRTGWREGRAGRNDHQSRRGQRVLHL